MNRNLLVLAIILLAVTASNAVPLLEKRYTSYMQCPLKPTPPPTLYVSTYPDPLVAGETATFYVKGKLSKPATKGSALVIAFIDEYDKVVGDPFVLDICKDIEDVYCPISKFDAHGPVPIPYKLPSDYVAVVFIVDPTGKYVLACAAAVVGSGGGTSYLTSIDSNSNSTSSYLTYATTSDITWTK